MSILDEASAHLDALWREPTRAFMRALPRRARRAAAGAYVLRRRAPVRRGGASHVSARSRCRAGRVAPRSSRVRDGDRVRLTARARGLNGRELKAFFDRDDRPCDGGILRLAVRGGLRARAREAATRADRGLPHRFRGRLRRAPRRRGGRGRRSPRARSRARMTRAAGSRRSSASASSRSAKSGSTAARARSSSLSTRFSRRRRPPARRTSW